MSLLLIMETCLIGAFSCNNLFIFLLFFEASSIPIYLLMVYGGSERRERLKASYFFLFFTLYGSIALLLVLLNVYTLEQGVLFKIGSSFNNSLMLWILLFLAFSVKIPLWPTHL